MSTDATQQRVLLVEDDPNVRKLLSRHLRQAGYDVAEAMDAENALLQLVNAQEYDLVVTDMHLPGRSGVELVRAVNEREARPPVLCLTGDADAGLAQSALDAGAAGYLLKPFEFFELDSVIRNALAPLAGRNLQPVLQQRHSMELMRRVARAPERVVLRVERRPVKRPARVGWKAVAAVAATVLFGWLAGAVLSPGQTRAPLDPPKAVAPASVGATMFVPLLLESK